MSQNLRGFVSSTALRQFDTSDEVWTQVEAKRVHCSVCVDVHLTSPHFLFKVYKIYKIQISRIIKRDNYNHTERKILKQISRAEPRNLGKKLLKP